MPFADKAKANEYSRQYKAARRAEAKAQRGLIPALRRPDQWTAGPKEHCACLSCGKQARSRPDEGCTEQRHREFHAKIRAGNNKYRKRQRAEARARGEVKRYGTPEAKREQTKRAYQIGRMRILRVLGGACSRCCFPDSRALEVHHKAGGGNHEREQLGWGYHLRLAKLPDAELRHAFELLCANCHAIEHAGTQ